MQNYELKMEIIGLGLIKLRAVLNFGQLRLSLVPSILASPFSITIQ